MGQLNALILCTGANRQVLTWIAANAPQLPISIKVMNEDGVECLMTETD